MKFKQLSVFFLMVLGCSTAIAMQPQRPGKQNTVPVTIENLSAEIIIFYTRDLDGQLYQNFILPHKSTNKDFAKRDLAIQIAHELTIFTKKGNFEVSDEGQSIILFTFAVGEETESGIKIAKRVQIASLPKNELKKGLQIIIEADNSVKIKKLS